MNSSKPKSIKDLFFFVALFSICIVGSIGIFLFAVGLDAGHPIVVGAMKALLDNFYLVFLSLLFFNVLIFYGSTRSARSPLGRRSNHPERSPDNLSGRVEGRSDQK